MFRSSIDCNFHIPQSQSTKGQNGLLRYRRSDSVFSQLHLQLCQSPVPVCQPTATELTRSPPLGSGTVFLSTSHLRRHAPPSAFVSKHTVIISVIHSTFVHACKVTSSLWTHKSFCTYLLTYSRTVYTNIRALFIRRE